VITLLPLDVIIIVCYFALILWVGFRAAARRSSGTVDYFLAGRSLTTPVFVMTLVSTWYGGILGVGEFSYRYGISNWVVQGVPYYLFAALFAFLLAGRIRATNFLTIPDKLHQAYGRESALLGGVLTFILMTPAPYILMLAVLLQVVSGWSFLLCLLVGTIASTAYLYFGGFRADVQTNVAEFILMFLGFAVILPFAYDKLGGWEFIASHVPPRHLTWNGGNSLQFVIVWFFIALWTLVDPAFHQRCYAARSGRVARNGILISILFWFVFDAMTATAGLYARAALPSLSQPVMAYPLLAEAILPSGAKGMFYVGMLATIMSTLNSLTFISATTLGRDLLWRARNGEPGETETSLSRTGLLLTAVTSIFLAILIPSVVKLWYTIGTVVIPGLLVPLVTSYFDRLRAPARHAFLSMLGGWVTSSVWLLLGWSKQIVASQHFPLGIEPMYPGVAVSLVFWGWGILRRPAGERVLKAGQEGPTRV
jgi:SSS family solute:Na+ symporter